jgi:hypothetical protein
VERISADVGLFGYPRDPLGNCVRVVTLNDLGEETFGDAVVGEGDRRRVEEGLRVLETARGIRRRQICISYHILFHCADFLAVISTQKIAAIEQLERRPDHFRGAGPMQSQYLPECVRGIGCHQFRFYDDVVEPDDC